MNTHIQRYSAIGVCIALVVHLLPLGVSAGTKDTVIYPIKEISKLECRFENFETLWEECKMDLPILNSKDYNKYAQQNNWYNDFTRIYTVLWGASYKYSWDVWSGWHQGTDIATAEWTPVYTIADWVVIESGSDVGWGKYVSIEHTINGQQVISNYAHLFEIDVKKWDKVDVGDKIWEVGSTGNSTGNHLHFQIDLPSVFHPYYYDYKACPYSYYQITEQGVCFDELQKNTYDPLVFLENNGEIEHSKSVEVYETSKKAEDQDTTKTQEKTTVTIKEVSIFDVYVSPENGTSDDVKQVQRIYNKLWYYSWNITWEYSHVYESIIEYQIDTWVISHEEDLWAWYFWPKTRAQTKIDYDAYVASGWQLVLEPSKIPVVTTEIVTESKDNEVKEEKEKRVVQIEKKEVQEVQTVSRENLMTREEREAKEVQDFLKIYSIDLLNIPSQIEANSTKQSLLQIHNSRGKWFRGNTPWHITFEYDTNLMSVFPESFYNFTDGEREIFITGNTEGNTSLKVKIGETIIQEYSITVSWAWVTITPVSAEVYTQSDIVMGNDNTAVVVMKDPYGNNITKMPYAEEFKFHSDNEIEYCIKRGNIEDIEKIYHRSCLPEEYSNSLYFTYEDTIDGLLVFDYKISNLKDTNLTLRKSSTSASLNQTLLNVSVPEWLVKDHAYYDDILTSLELWISDGIRSWYFMEDRDMTQSDAKRWIRNVLRNTWDSEMEARILKEVPESNQSLTRQQFLELTHSYLVESEQSSLSRAYRDLDKWNEVMVASLLWSNYEWNDDFWEFYFQPDKKISRWEASYMMLKALENWNQSYLAKR